jgi:two-component system NarL family sensor kinase
MAAAIDPKHDAALGGDDAIAAVLVDELGRVLEATSPAAAILGRRPAEIAGRDLQELVVDGWNWVVRNALLRLASGSYDPFELLLRGRSGRRSLVQMIPRRLPMNPAPGEPKQYMLVWLEQRQDDARGPITASEAELRRHAYGLLKTHEAELGRVASELHDGVAPLVVMAKFMIEDAVARLGRGAQREAADLMVTTVARLREVLAEVRRISTELRPSSLEDLGLLPTIEWHCRNVAQTYHQLRLTTDLAVEESLIPEALKLDIFRIVQESLNNVVRHARATEVRVVLRAAEGRLQLQIEDNGIGFEVETLLRGTSGHLGLGLHSMRKRADATRGALNIESSPWRGTRVEANWPLNAGAT